MTDGDMPALRRVDDWAFGVTSSQRRWEVGTAMLERERQLGAFVGRDLAGHAAALTMSLSVPGGTVPAAGVTWVMVSPRHRRRGVVSALMDRQLQDLRDDGEPVAVLWASEPGIYPRFGYGLGSRRVSVDVARAHAGMRPVAGGSATLVLGDVADLLPQCRDAYDEVRARVPGMVTRSAGCWSQSSFDDPDRRGDGSALRCALAVGTSGEPRGFAWFQTQVQWSSGSPDGPVEVREIVADSPAATRTLLGHLLDVDLTSRCTIDNLPLDHPLLTWLNDPRRARPVLADGLWVRLVRVDEALAARTYAASVDVVIELSDDRCPWNSGRWRLAADATGCEIARTPDPADLTLDVRDLAGGYLGDDHLGRAVVAGLVEEHTAGSARALARAMLGERPPWCSFVF